MSDELLAQLAGTTGPVGTFLLVFAVWVRSQFRELGTRLDGHERRLIQVEQRNDDA